jgi:hypothetical protein
VEKIQKGATQIIFDILRGEGLAKVSPNITWGRGGEERLAKISPDNFYW